jgi:hypothetical protein
LLLWLSLAPSRLSSPFARCASRCRRRDRQA